MPSGFLLLIYQTKVENYTLLFVSLLHPVLKFLDSTESLIDLSLNFSGIMIRTYILCVICETIVFLSLIMKKVDAQYLKIFKCF